LSAAFKSYLCTANSKTYLPNGHSSRELFCKLIKFSSAFITYPIVKKEVLLRDFDATVTALHHTLTPMHLSKKPLTPRWLATGKSPPNDTLGTANLRLFKDTRQCSRFPQSVLYSLTVTSRVRECCEIPVGYVGTKKTLPNCSVR
jgi:hypothetical protein